MPVELASHWYVVPGGIVVGGQLAEGPNSQPASGSRDSMMLFPQSKTSAGQIILVGDVKGDAEGEAVDDEEEVGVLPGQINAVQAGTPPSPQTQ
mmetsp:Transcript_32050/g.94315  ORF Transcript_32050/g.94315 Transcript_32050/m.94315 type:complete len:94 (+) Transcript_32050:1344-1625(+)